jgi:hypothetical protein
MAAGTTGRIRDNLPAASGHVPSLSRARRQRQRLRGSGAAGRRAGPLVARRGRTWTHGARRRCRGSLRPHPPPPACGSRAPPATAAGAAGSAQPQQGGWCGAKEKRGACGSPRIRLRARKGARGDGVRIPACAAPTCTLPASPSFAMNASARCTACLQWWAVACGGGGHGRLSGRGATPTSWLRLLSCPYHLLVGWAP